MRKIYSLLTMLIVTLLSYNASAATNWTITLDIDNPAAVTLSQNYDGSNPIALNAGTNEVTLIDDYGYGASFYLSCNGDYIFTSILEDGSQAYLYDNKRYSGYVSSNGRSFVVRTGDLSKLRTEYVTINIDNAAGASVRRNSDMLTLENGSNTIWYIPGTETPFFISHAQGYHKQLGSVKYNGEEIPYVQYEYYTVEPSNGGVIDIVTYNPNTPRYTLTLEGNLNAISEIQIAGNAVTGWESGSLSLEEDTSGNIIFDNDNYKFSEVFVDGYDQNISEYCYPIYFYMSSDKTISFNATAKGGDAPVVTGNKATFTLNGWDNNGFGINEGTSEWDSAVDFNSSNFDVEFAGDTQSYYIYTTGDYRLDRVTLTHGGKTTAKSVIGSGPHHCTVEVADGDVVEVTISKFVDVYTATLTVTADLAHYNGDITIENASKHVKDQVIFNGDNTFKFNPGDSDDRNFTIKSSTGNLYSVKNGGVTVTGNKGVYALNNLADGARVEIQAVDPASVTTTPAQLVFADDNVNAAIRSVLVNNVDLATSDYAAGTTYSGANVGDLFIVYFNQGYEISNFVFGNTTYNYNPNITSGQPLDLVGDSYQFSAYIEDEYMPVSFKATLPTVSYSKLVTFNVNTPAGVKVTDTSDGKNEVLNIDSTTFYHTFTSEYNYIDIESAEGYDLTRVNINPNDGNASYERTPSDNKVGSVSVDEHYIITIEVTPSAAGPSTPEYGTVSVKVVGNPSQIELYNNSTNEVIPLAAGDNTINLWAEVCGFNIMPQGDGIDSVTLNGTPVTITNLPFMSFYALSTVKADDEIIITTVGASEEPEVPTASFKVTVSGDLASISYLMDESRTEYDLELGENTFALPSATASYQFMLSGAKALYSVKLNGDALNSMYGGTTFMFSIKAGDHLEIETEFPKVDVAISWAFTGCDSSIVTGIQINNNDKVNADDEAFAAYLDGFTVSAGDIVAYWIDTTNYNVTSVKHNDASDLTGSYHSFSASEDTQIAITASQKRVYNWTLVTNQPSHLLVYSGAYGNGQNIVLDDNETTLEVNEVNGTTFFTIGKAYGYLFDEANCTIDGARLTVNAEGLYVVYPEENSVVTITLAEVARPNVAALYIDDITKANYVALYSGRFSAYSSFDADATSGYQVFHFNNDDLGDGFTLTVEPADEEATPWIYINNELVTGYNADTHQVSGIQLADGDVVKVYLHEQPAVNNLTISHIIEGEEADMFSVIIDHITEVKPDARFRDASIRVATEIPALTGTEVTVTANAFADDPWVKVDGQYNQFKAGESFTFPVTGEHTIAYGQHYGNTTVITDLVEDMTGANAADIYNLQGVCIKRNAVSSDVKSLAPGVYIIGGHKVRVK